MRRRREEGGRFKLMIVGLTGGIATGKSLVSNELKRLGAHIIDADIIAREIVEPGEPAYGEIVREFGRSILKEDGTLDRKGLGRIVFSDKEALEKLNAITHPRIKERITQEALEIEKRCEDPVIVVDIALLIELGMHTAVSSVIVVYSPEDEQIRRMLQRDGLTEQDARDRLKAQMPIKEKLKYADHIIENTGTVESALARTRDVWEEIMRLKNVKKGT